MVKFKKTTLSFVSVGLAACFSASIAAAALASANGGKGASVAKTDDITRVNASIDKRTSDFLDSDIVTRLSDNIDSNQEISVILSLDTKSTFDAYLESGRKGEFSDYLETASAKKIAKKNKAASDDLKRTLDRTKISYKVGNNYEHLISGFEVILRAKDYYKLADAVRGSATTMVGEVYAPAEAEVVTNEVDVYDTGIFDSSSCEYQGDGVVVAVLDTGLDYTHTAFSVSNFEADEEDDAFTLDTVIEAVNATDNNGRPRLTAANTTVNLKGEDVYVSRKVPFAYDYADKDADVFPLSSEHGTHVAGVIAGKDDTITGVAPNAQLAIMKVFSDKDSGARTSWILAALEDCVTLGVDVINMSLGSPAGFTTQDDDEKMQKIYSNIKENGISLITAAGNENNAVTGSDKNGSNPLTSNPDSGIVGSPSTFESALSVASVGGVKTPYFLFNGEIIYFTEAATSSAKTKNFVNDILGDKQSQDFEYVTIAGVGRRSDYTEDREYYRGKIVLVKRGETNFEEKVDIALRIMKAAGIIIYNNVSGAISMQVGAVDGAVCSLTQDLGEKLAAHKTGILKISKSQVAGPFMSDFSSWGPTSDLRIKPEITAHGGEILSAIPGQSYDRLSGTSMASPNMAGAAALIRQFVKDNTDIFGNLSPVEVTKRVNQLAMSTADIVRNKNGLAYAVRKQGAGLVNIGKATTAEAYIATYQNGVEMDKSKLELGDDKNKTGVYEMTFDIKNISDKSLSYNVGSIVLTEGVSTSYTDHGETTVTTDGYALNPKTEIVSVSGGATKSGDYVTVGAKSSTKITVKITLSEADKAYLNDSFENGMYVEGYITLKAADGAKLNMNVPFLAFYGDWTEAPIFDEEYYDTNADELNQGIDNKDKLMADAYATRVIGGYYSDYIVPLGTYIFTQNPSATPIAANKEHIALSNYQDGEASSVHSIKSIAAGLLRNVKEWKLTITEDSTGEVIWEKEDRNQRKSSTSGITIYQSNMDVDFSVAEHNLKNNTKYTVTVETYIDYGSKEDQKNKRNTFTFPLYIDFEAPVVTSVDYRTEYDQSTKKNRLYADLNIYDNHYAMSVQFGRIIDSGDSSQPFMMDSFGKYMTPVYSSYNSTSKVTLELTDYVKLIKESRGIKFNSDGTISAVDNYNSFTATCYDYAMNSATYEIRLPDEVLAMNFDEEEIRLSPNETLDLTTKLNIFPATTWAQVLDFKSSNTNIVEIVNQTAIAKTSGSTQRATVTATGKNKDGKEMTASVDIYVCGAQDSDYKKYDPPMVYKAEIAKYETVKAFYEVSPADRDIGLTGGTYFFEKDYNLSMYPSETVNLICDVQTYFSVGSNKTLKYTSSRPEIASVNEKGQIVALSKGSAAISVNAEVVYYDGGVPKKTSYLVGTVNITVKDPYTASGMYLVSYKGLGGKVVIPDDRGFTTIQAYAFSNYDFVEKDLSAGDEISEEDPYYTKQTYIGEDTIEEIVIPEGVTTIEPYAFANLTALKKVTLPSTLTTIGVGAFYGCYNLTEINLENVKFINDRAFMGCNLAKAEFNEIIAIGSYAFAYLQITSVSGAYGRFTELNLPASAQSIDSGAFYGCLELRTVNFASDDVKIKLGEYVFRKCSKLTKIKINAVVIPTGAFFECKELSDVTLGKDVSVFGEEAFAGTKVSSFKLAEGSALTTNNGGKYVYNNGVLVLVAPVLDSKVLVLDDMVSVARGAFAGNASIESVSSNSVTSIEPYAFADCPNLKTIDFPNLKTIGAWAFAGSGITELTVKDGVTIGECAFYNCQKLAKVVIGDNVTIGNSAFMMLWTDHTFWNNPYFETLNEYYDKYKYTAGDGANKKVLVHYSYKFAKTVHTVLTDLTIGNNVTIGDFAFQNAAKLEKFILGTGAKIGMNAFYDATGLEIDLSEVVEIGDGAFSGSRDIDVWEFTVPGSTQKYYREAYEWVDAGNGQVRAVDNLYSYFAPSIKAKAESTDRIADLSKVTSLGEGAFAFNQSLTGVILPQGLTEIPAYAFVQCRNLESAAIPDSVTSIGEYAFFRCGSLRASSTADTLYIPAGVTSVGEYAFGNTNVNIRLDNNLLEYVGEGAFGNSMISAVSFAKDAVIGESAFYNCDALGGEEALAPNAVKGLDQVAKIGAWAFAGTSIAAADLSGATEIGDFAFAQSDVATVTFSESLDKIGENPFAGCPIESFAKTVRVVVDDKFPDYTVEKEIDTYDVNESKTIKVINNVLYRVVPKGLQLVCYPGMAKATAYTVEENTVRIGAAAFYKSLLVNVTLPRSLKAIGDQAFFLCGNLTTVIFNSLQAPILEEQYDPSYVSDENLPLSGNHNGEEGLGISKYYMWNASGYGPAFYYGANFIYYIGRMNPDLVMISPVNGTGYNSFIFEQYFGTFIDGSTAITDDTLRVIAMIEKLKSGSEITLDDKAEVEAARRAYEALSGLDQKALVSNYSKLTSAEDTIAYLESKVDPGEPDVPPTNGNNGSVNALGIAGFTVAGVLLIALAVFAAYVFLGKKKAKTAESDGKDTSDEDGASDGKDNDEE